MRLPNFVVIGAAKAGTTALYWYLAEQPQIHMSPLKETNFFAYGLDESGRLLYGDPELHRFPIRTLQDYRTLFDGAGDAIAIGEVSPIYLECPQAAGRIAMQLPEARIICGLRNPVDRAYSDYQMYLRARGRRLDPQRDLTPVAAWAQADSHWIRIGRYHEHLSRYFAAHRRADIHIYLFDDLRARPSAVVQGIYRFLGVDDGFVPNFDTPHNVGGVPASMTFERVMTSKRIRAAVEPWIPQGVANAVRRIRTSNLRRAPALPAELRTHIIGHYRDEIARTADLIGRDLQHWLRADA